MLRLIMLNANSIYLNQAMKLYRRAFPSNERQPLAPLLNDPLKQGEIFGALDDKGFAGFFVLLTYKDITHILYLAIEEDRREYGYGSEILKLIQMMYPNNRIIADVEMVEEDSENYLQRKKRMHFYLRNGYQLTEVRYRWEEEDYVILTSKGTLSTQKFREFWNYFYQNRSGFIQ